MQYIYICIYMFNMKMITFTQCIYNLKHYLITKHKYYYLIVTNEVSDPILNTIHYIRILISSPTPTNLTPILHIV